MAQGGWLETPTLWRGRNSSCHRGIVTPAGIGLWALVALAQTGPAVSVPIRVEFDAPAGCSDADAFFAGVLARARRVHRARPGETAIRLTIHVSRAGGRVHGELRVNEAGGEAETRRVDGATCAEVVQVLSLTAALAIDPTADLLPPAAPERPTATPSPVRAPSPAGTTPSPVRAAPSATPPPAPAPLSAPPVASPSPAPAVVAPPAQPAVPPAPALPERTAAAAPASVTPPPPPVAPAPAATVVTEPAHQPARPSGPRVGASMVGARVLGASVGLGASLWGRLGTTTRDGLTPSVTLGALYLPGDFFGSGDDLGIAWVALAASACPGWTLGGRVRIEPCARITGGFLSVTDHSVNTPRSVDRWWGSVGALLRLTAPIGAGLMIDFDAGVDFPVVTRRFITTTTMTNQPVGATSSVSPTLSVGLSHSL
jgi:hypothetical protein